MAVLMMLGLATAAGEAAVVAVLPMDAGVADEPPVAEGVADTDVDAAEALAALAMAASPSDSNSLVKMRKNASITCRFGEWG